MGRRPRRSRRRPRRRRRPRSRRRKRRRRPRSRRRRKRRRKRRRRFASRAASKKGQHKSKASVAAGKKNAAKQKAAGKGLFKVRTCSAALTAITGKSKMTCPAIVKAVWGYIKSKKLNNKRMINPDGALGKVIGGKTSMFKMNKALFKHVK